MALEPQPHIVAMPGYVNIIRAVQAVLAVFIFAVSIYGAVGGAIAGVGLNLFTSLVTILYLIYLFFATHRQPVIYHHWAILGLEIFLILFWLISFAVLASEVAIANAYDCGGYYDYYGYYYSTACGSGTRGIIALFGICAAAGAIEFVLFIVTLALFAMRLMARHRTGGALNAGGLGAAAPTPYNQNSGVAQEKFEMQPQVQPQTHPVNTTYPSQGIDPRYGGGESVAQPVHQEYPVQHQVPQQLATHEQQATAQY